MFRVNHEGPGLVAQVRERVSELTWDQGEFLPSGRVPRLPKAGKHGAPEVETECSFPELYIHESWATRQTGAVGASVSVTISGVGFGSTAGTVTTTAGSQIQVAIKGWTDGTINTTFTISGTASTGTYTVVVTTSATAACPSCQAQTSFYITKSCSPTVLTPSQTVACDGKTVRQAQLTVGGSDEGNVTDTVVSATSSSILVVDPQGSPYQYTTLCPSGEICWAQDYVGYTGTGIPKSASINWSAQIFCSNSPYPSETVNKSATITCQ
jgi:hypothetical protein